jgi:hypothetical protein
MVLHQGGKRPDHEGCPGLRPGKRSPPPRRGKTATGPLSMWRSRASWTRRSRSCGVAHLADKAQKRGAKPRLLHLRHAHLYRPGLRGNQSWPGWSVCQKRREVQHAFRGRPAETGSSTWHEFLASDPRGRFRGSSLREMARSRAWSEATDRLLTRGREGGRKRRPRQARVTGIEAGLVSEETGRAPDDHRDQAGQRTSCTWPATLPEGGIARHT